MHEWHTNSSTNILQLIDEFMGYEFRTDYGGNQEVTNVRVTNKMYSNENEALNYVTNVSYGSNTACLAAYSNQRISKAYQNAFNKFEEKREDYLKLKKELTIGYGRKSSKVTCPNCGSSINLNYGKRFKVCPVCGSKKIISDSNWKILETKKKLMEKAAEVLSQEAQKNGVTFICGIEWHC